MLNGPLFAVASDEFVYVYNGVEPMRMPLLFFHLTFIYIYILIYLVQYYIARKRVQLKKKKKSVVLLLCTRISEIRDEEQFKQEENKNDYYIPIK